MKGIIDFVLLKWLNSEISIDICDIIILYNYTIIYKYFDTSLLAIK